MAAPTKGQLIEKFVNNVAYYLRVVNDVTQLFHENNKDTRFKWWDTVLQQVRTTVDAYGNTPLSVDEVQYIRLHLRECVHESELFRIKGTLKDDAKAPGGKAPDKPSHAEEAIKKLNDVLVNASSTDLTYDWKKAEPKQLDSDMAAHIKEATLLSAAICWRIGHEISQQKESAGLSVSSTQAQSNALMALTLAVVTGRDLLEKLWVIHSSDSDQQKYVRQRGLLTLPVRLEQEWSLALLSHWGLVVTSHGVTSKVGKVPDGDTDSKATAKNRKKLSKFVATKDAGVSLGMMAAALSVWETSDPNGYHSKSTLGSQLKTFIFKRKHKDKLFPDLDKDKDLAGLVDMLGVVDTPIHWEDDGSAYSTLSREQWAKEEADNEQVWSKTLADVMATFTADRLLDP